MKGMSHKDFMRLCVKPDQEGFEGTGLVLQQQADRVPLPWKNGRGICFDIAAVGDPESDDWWELSTAALEQDAPFSHFPGINRQFCVAQGAVELTIDGCAHSCEEGSVTTFDGGSVTSCRLLGDKGPRMALNLMQRGSSATGQNHSLALYHQGFFLSPTSSSLTVEAIVAVGGPAVIIVATQEKQKQAQQKQQDQQHQQRFDLDLLDALLLINNEHEHVFESLQVVSGSVAVLSKPNK